MTAIIILLYVFSFLVIWQFVAYPSVMGLIALLSNSKRRNLSYQPYVSIIVAAFNEERVIEKRIENLLELDYAKDKYEIILVDDGSSDNTCQIVEQFIANRKADSESPLRLVRHEERKGKASAINLGKQYALGDILLGTDANSAFDRNVLKEMMPHFKNPRVGAVGGRYVTSNPGNSLASSESFYWDLENIMRTGESALESACFFNGAIAAWRKGIVETDTQMIGDDLDMAIQIKRAGYKIQYEPRAIVYESSATTLVDQVKQRKRTTVSTLQCMFKHKAYFLFPRDLYSLVIFPSHKGLTMLSPFTLSAIPILYIISHNSEVIVPHLIVTVSVFALLLSLLMLLKARLVKREKGGITSISSLPRIAYYVLLNEYIILLGWGDFLFGKRSVLWEKAESTRQGEPT